MDQMEAPRNASAPASGTEIDYFVVQAFSDRHKLSYNETAAMVRAAVAAAAPAQPVSFSTNKWFERAMTFAVTPVGYQQGDMHGLTADVVARLRTEISQEQAFLDSHSNVAPVAIAPMPADTSELLGRIKRVAAHWAYMAEIDNTDAAEKAKGEHTKLVFQLAAAPKAAPVQNPTQREYPPRPNILDEVWPHIRAYALAEDTNGRIDHGIEVDRAIETLLRVYADATCAANVDQNAARFKNACHVHTNLAVLRYLMSNAEGRLDGSEKAHRHIELCRFYTSAITGHIDTESVRHDHEELFQAIHTKTQELTDYLDEQIGFPLQGRPDYDALAPKFFERFHTLAMSAALDHQEGGAK